MSAISIVGNISAPGNVKINSQQDSLGSTIAHTISGANVNIIWTGKITNAITASGTLSLSVTGEIDSTETISAAQIVLLYASGNIISNVTSTGDIINIDGLSINGAISASRDILNISSYTDVEGSVSATGTIYEANANRDWKHNSLRGRLKSLTAGRDIDSIISVTGDIGKTDYHQ